MDDFIFVAGAPGSGKTTITHLPHERLQSSAITFGALRVFHLDSGWTNVSAAEEQMSHDNLVFILEKYADHGYTNVIVTDLQDVRVVHIPDTFAAY